MSLAGWILEHFGPQLAWILSSIRSRSVFTGPGSDEIEKIRGGTLRLFDPVVRPFGRPLVRKKGTKDYICTVSADVERLEKALYPTYQRNLLATKKYRKVDGQKQWTNGSWVHTESYSDPLQHHLYMFPAPNNEVDIYGHREADVSQPDEHHKGGQTHGDPDEILRSRLEQNSIDYRKRSFS